MPARKRKSARKTIPAIRAAVPKPVPLAQARSALNRARRAVFARTAAKMMTTRATAFDDQARDFLDNIELKKVLAEVARRLRRPIDVVGFDAVPD